ncbi:hypothetical protein EYS14_06440 [Alteromonadaceae bacterium M269]|nr:hypothetical protein EYS14_06440 [Alteromonadaceae bacterium M269]
MSSDLTKTFGISTETLSGESLEELRAHYFTHANMRELDDTSVGGLRIQAGSRKHTADMERKKQQATSDFLLIEQLTRQLEAVTEGMVAKYGEGFAAQFAAQYLDKETFERLNQIDDINERRKAFAKAINDRIKDGSINADEAYANPDLAEWLGKHEELRRELGSASPLYSVEVEKTAEISPDTSLDNDLQEFLSNNPI